MKTENISQAQAVIIPHKEWLKAWEAYLYTGLKKSAFSAKCSEYGIEANRNGYYNRKQLNLILSGAPTKFEVAASNIPDEVKRRRA